MSKPKIYYFTHNCPFGPSYGARMRTRYLAEMLSEIAELRLVVTPLETLAPEDLEMTAARFDLAGVIGFEPAAKSLGDRFRDEAVRFTGFLLRRATAEELGRRRQAIIDE